MLTPKDAWQATLGQLQLQLNRSTFDTWLKGAELVAYEDGEFIIRVRHAYAKDWLEKHLAEQITQALGRIFERSVRVNFVVYLPHRKAKQSAAGPLFTAAQPSEPMASARSNGSQPSGEPEGPSTKAEDKALADAKDTGETNGDANAATQPETQSASSDYSEWDPRVTDVRHTTTTTPTTVEEASLDQRYTFELFVTGPSNQFAHAAAQAVAETPGKRYNPLVIDGGTGLGKTHLLQAIGHASRAGGRRVIYITAEAFTNEMVTAIRARKMDEFRERFRKAEVLLLDDLQFMAGKSSTEEEFYHTFSTIFSQGGQVVVACDQHPRTNDKLDERLRSRLEGGLRADIQPPELETRLAILRAKSTAQGTTLPDDVATILARHTSGNVRELEGLLTQVLARATLAKQPLTAALAEQVISKNGAQPRRRTMNVAQVLEATATYHQLSLDDLLSKRRTKDVVRARQIAMYLAREETDASYPQIGAALGGRNHSTVLYGYQKIARTVESDEALRHEIGDIRRQLYLFSTD
jgi:chromosomal replication initiator protein